MSGLYDEEYEREQGRAIAAADMIQRALEREMEQQERYYEKQLVALRNCLDEQQSVIKAAEELRMAQRDFSAKRMTMNADMYLAAQHRVWDAEAALDAALAPFVKAGDPA